MEKARALSQHKARLIINGNDLVIAVKKGEGVEDLVVLTNFEVSHFKVLPKDEAKYNIITSPEPIQPIRKIKATFSVIAENCMVDVAKENLKDLKVSIDEGNGKED